MKKIVPALTIIILTFIFTACPFLFDDMDKHNFMTPEELVAKMNTNIGNHFTLINYDTVIKNDDYKYLVVTLKADDLPNQVVTAYQFFQWTLGDELSDMSPVYTSPARTTINIVEEYLVTDYYFLKYKDDLFSKITEIYEPLLNKLNENENYLLAIKPELIYFPIIKTHYAQNNYKDAIDILANASISTHLLIHSKNYPDKEEINSISEAIKDIVPYHYFRGYLYYSSKYSPSEVSTEALINGTFYNETDEQKNFLVKYYVY